MAKCKALTGSAVKGLSHSAAMSCAPTDPVSTCPSRNVALTRCFLWKSMNENGRETLRALVLCGLAARLRDSKAIMRSTQPAGRFALNVSMKSTPKISPSSFSNSASIPRQPSFYIATIITTKLKEQKQWRC